MTISVEQIALRWRPALRQAHVIETQPFTAQVCQYLLNHQWVFDAGNDIHTATADTTRFDVDIKNTRFERCAQLTAAWLATGVALSGSGAWALFARPRRAGFTRSPDLLYRYASHHWQPTAVFATTIPCARPATCAWRIVNYRLNTGT